MTTAATPKIDHAEDDLELIREFQTGQESGFTRLVERYQQRVLNLIFSLVGRREEVEDLAQEIFIKVYHHLAEFEGRAAFRSWLYRITVNACIDYTRKRKLQRWFSWEGLDEWAKEQFWFRHATAPATDAATERQELDHYIQRALMQLSANSRRVLVLRDLEGLEYEEIAAITGWSLGTVKSRLFRARRRMRNFLQPYLESKK